MDDTSLAEYIGWVISQLKYSSGAEDAAALNETAEDALLQALMLLSAKSSVVLENAFARFFEALATKVRDSSDLTFLGFARELTCQMLTVLTPPSPSDDSDDQPYMRLKTETHCIQAALSAALNAFQAARTTDDTHAKALVESLSKLGSGRHRLAKLVCSQLCSMLDDALQKDTTSSHVISQDGLSTFIVEHLQNIQTDRDKRDSLEESQLTMMEDSLRQYNRALMQGDDTERPKKRRKTDDGSAAPADDIDDFVADEMYSGMDAPAKKNPLCPPGQFDLGLGHFLTRTDLNNIMLESLLNIDILSFEGFQTAHLEGLEQNMIQHARTLQIAEIKRDDKKETLRVERNAKVDLTKLLIDVDAKDSAVKRSSEQLYQSKAEPHDNAVMLSAFGAIGEAFGTLKNEGKHSMLHGAALISRLIASRDVPRSHTLLNRMLYTCVETVAPRDLETSLSFAIQLLYSYYACTAPFEMQEDKRIFSSSFENTASSPDCEIDIKNPLLWLKKGDEDEENDTFTFKDKEGTYSYVFERILKALKSHLTREVSANKIALSMLLLECPMVPKRIWGILHEQFCLSDDSLKTWGAMQAFCDIIVHRPAARCKALSYFLYYAVCDKPQTRVCAINYLMYDILKHDISLKAVVVDFVTHTLAQLEEVPSTQETPEADLEMRLHEVIPLYLALTMIEPSLLSHLFALYENCKRSGKVRHMKAILSDENIAKVVRKIGVAKIVPILSEHANSDLVLHLTRLAIKATRDELHEVVIADEAEDHQGVPPPPRFAQERPPTGNAEVDRLAELFPALPPIDSFSPAVPFIEADLDSMRELALTLYTHSHDARFLIVLLSITPKNALRHRIFPLLLSTMKKEHISIAIREAVSSTPHHLRRGLGMTPMEVIRYLHCLVPDKAGKVAIVGGDSFKGAKGSLFENSIQSVTLRHVVSAIDLCVTTLHEIFSEQEMRALLPMLANEVTLTPYLMRTVLQSLGVHPQMLSFVLASIMPLVLKKSVWKDEDQVCKGFYPFLDVWKKIHLNFFFVLSSIDE